MADPASKVPPLPLMAVELPANPEPPEEPLAQPAAQPVAANQVITSFWRFSFILSFSYLFVHVLCFSPTFRVLILSCCTAIFYFPELPLLPPVY